MPTWGDYFRDFDWTGLFTIAFTVAASLLCITLHELSHGLAAYALGDPTAKDAGRLTLNPIKHLDLLGLLMMVVAHVGWAKPVPIDLRRFKRPRRDMALTALAGPASNILIALVSLLLGRLVYEHGIGGEYFVYVLLACMYVAVLSLGMGLFNLIPISPLDGSKILLFFLPEKAARAILRRERYIALGMLALAWLGVFDRPLNFLMGKAMYGLCAVSGFPYDLMSYFFF